MKKTIESVKKTRVVRTKSSMTSKIGVKLIGWANRVAVSGSNSFSRKSSMSIGCGCLPEDRV